MSAAVDDKSQNLRWFQGLDRYCWVVLTIAALGWLFDTMDQNIWNLVRTPSLEALLTSEHTINGVVDKIGLAADAKAKGGIITAIFLIGWSVGGFVFGVLG